MIRHLTTAAFAVFFSMILVACQDAPYQEGGKEPSEAEQLVNDVSRSISGSLESAVERAKGVVAEVRPQQLAKEEFGKLSSWEYHVERLFLPTTQQDLSIRLNELGQENWECDPPTVGLTGELSSGERMPPALLTPSEKGSGIRPARVESDTALMICKRRPRTVLRMVPRLVP